jgi:hypothetical protein
LQPSKSVFPQLYSPKNIEKKNSSTWMVNHFMNSGECFLPNFSHQKHFIIKLMKSSLFLFDLIWWMIFKYI